MPTPQISPSISRPMSATTALGGATGAAYIPPLSGGLRPLALWDARHGITLTSGAVSKWTDIIRKLPLTDNGTTTRPLHVVDYEHFGGKKVVQFDGVNDTLQNLAISPALIPAGTRPHWFAVLRYRGASGTVFSCMDAVVNAYTGVQRTNSLLTSNTNAYIATGSDPLANVHVVEDFISAATGVATLGMDGVDATAGTGLVLSQPITRVWLGNWTLTSFGAVSIAAIGCYAAELTAQQRIDLRAHYAIAYPASVSTLAPPPIGATPLVLWDARAGVETVGSVVSSWVDTVRGLPLYDNGSTTRPAYGPDYNYFGGQSVVQFDGVNDTLQAVNFAPVFAASARPHFFVVFRYRGALGHLFSALDNPVAYAVPRMYRTAGLLLEASGAGAATNVGDPFAAEHVLEYFITAAGTVKHALDGVDVTGGSSASMLGAFQTLYLGNDRGQAGSFGAVSIAAIGCYAAELTAQQRIDLRAYYAAAFPAPALNPSDFLTNLLVWVDPAFVTTSLGKVSALTNRGNQGGVLTQATAGLRATVNVADASFANKSTLSIDNCSYPLPTPGSYPGMECFVVGVHASDPPATGGGGFQRQGSDGANPGMLPAGDAGRLVHGEFATTARKSSLGPFAVDFALPWLLDMWSAPSDWGLRHNRVTLYTTGANGVGALTGGTILSDNRGGAYYFVGKWAAYILCGAKQTPAQRAQLEAWVLATYGV